MYNPVSPRFRTKKNRFDFVSAISFGCSKLICAYHQKRKGRKNCVQKLWHILILIFCKCNIFLLFEKIFNNRLKRFVSVQATKPVSPVVDFEERV
jgi:hypothetical protein